MYHNPHLYAIYGVRNVVSCVFARGSKDKESYVMFRKTQNILLSILDLCVFQEVGAAKIEIGNDCPEGVIPAWQDHYKRLQKEFKKAVNRFERINKAIKLYENKENKIEKYDMKYIRNTILSPSSLINTRAR